MRAMAVVFSLLLAFAGCGGDDGGEEAEPDVVVKKDTGGGGTSSIECSKTFSCDFGEVCVEHVCQIPEGYGPADIAFDFKKKDECQASETYGQEVALSDFHGSVVLLYFAITPCDACEADSQVYEGLVDGMEYKGYVGMTKMISVLLPNTSSQLPAFEGNLKYPVLLDDTETGIADHYQAGKDTVVLISKGGYVAHSWPKLEVRGGGTDKPVLNEALIKLVEADY